MSAEYETTVQLALEQEEKLNDRNSPENSEIDNIIFQHPSQQELAWADIKNGFKKWRIWLMLAYQDIKLRYRRSFLGPLWLTLSMAITVYSMGYLYAHLFHIDLQTYYPFLIAGMLTWTLLSSMVTELTDGLSSSDTLLKQIKLPYSLHIQRIICRNIIIFFHNLLVLIPILIIYHQYTKVNIYTLLFIPGLVVIYFNAICYGLILAMIGARFRDISQVIKSLIQVIFFMTPVMWSPEILKEHNRYIADLNPFYAFLELIRAPLLGHIPTHKNLLMITIMTVLGMILSFRFFKQYRARIIYWL